MKSNLFLLRNFLKTVFVFFLLLSVSSCATDETDNIDNVASTDNPLKTYASEHEILKGKTLMWDYAVTEKLVDGSDFVSVPVKIEDPSTFEKVTFNVASKNIHASLWVLKSTGKDFNDTSYASKIHNIIGDFTGIVTYNDLQDPIQQDMEYVNGNLITKNTPRAERFNGEFIDPACNICHSSEPNTIMLEGVTVTAPSLSVSIPSINWNVFDEIRRIKAKFDPGVNIIIGTEKKNNAADSPPPSCESFNFRKTTSDAHWQEAAVKNIRFKIVVYTPPNNIRVTQSIVFPQAVLFGMPTNMVVGGNISPGMAAELSAEAIKVSMDETVDRYGGKYVSQLIVTNYFRERLIENYQMMTNGGRVNFNSTSNITPTEYKTTLFGTGDCQ